METNKLSSHIDLNELLVNHSKYLIQKTLIMKLLKKYMAVIAVFSLVFSSCTKEENNLTDDPASENFAELSLGASLNSLVNRTAVKQSLPECSSEAPAYAHVELTHNMGTALEGTIEINVPILEEDGAYYTDYDEGLKIPVANSETNTAMVSLTTFLVYDGDPEDEASSLIWATPTTASDYGSLVSQGLPFDFTIRAGSKKYVDIEVLCFDDRDVNLYGYQFFDLVPVEIHEFCVFANYCNDAGRHFTANYTFDITYIGDDNNIPLYTGEMPMTGNTEDDDSGDWYADPLCLAIPAPIYGEGPDTDYIRVTATLANWDANYPAPGAVDPISADLSWNEVQSFFVDGDNMDYWHIFFNCEDDGGNGNGECDPQNPADDCDGDTIPNGQDNCPETANADQGDLDEDGIGDACDTDIDGDGILNVDENEGCIRNPDPECGETGVEPCLPEAPDGCQSTDALNINLDNAGPSITNVSYGDWTVQIVDGELFVGVTPIIPFEISDIEVVVLESATCETVTVPDEGGSVTIPGITEGDLPLSISVRANICDVSGE